jgi:hypothetical protein
MVWVHFVPGSVDHSNAGIPLEQVPVAFVKMPVKGVEGAGVFANFFSNGIAAFRAVVALLVKVGPAAYIGFGSHNAAVGLEVMGKPLYAVQEGEHFLAVVWGVAEFFFGFKQGVDDVFARAVKPGMLGVELVSQDEPQNHGFGVFLESPRQRSEQNLT